MMKLYHGTNKLFTKSLLEKTDFIDVSKGRGELGQGFYTSKDCGLVSIWAKAKFKSDASMIEFEIDEFEYTELEILMIKKMEEVWENYHDKLNDGQHKLFNVDVVEGPYMSIDSRIQHKFESRKSEALLNKSISRIK